MASASTSTTAPAIAPAITPNIASVSLSHPPFWSTSRVRPIASRIWAAINRAKPGPKADQSTTLIHQLPSKTFKLHKQSHKLQGKDREIDQLRYWLNGRGQQAGELFMRIDEEQKRRKGVQAKYEKLCEGVKELVSAHNMELRKVAELELKLAERNLERAESRLGPVDALVEPRDHGAAEPVKDHDAAHPASSDSVRAISNEIADSDGLDRDAMLDAVLEAVRRRLGLELSHTASLEAELEEANDELKSVSHDVRTLKAQNTEMKDDVETLEFEKRDLESEKSELFEEITNLAFKLCAERDDNNAREGEWTKLWDVIAADRLEWFAAAKRLSEEVKSLDGENAMLTARYEEGRKGFCELVAYGDREYDARMRAEARLAELGYGGTCGESCSEVDLVADEGEVLEVESEASAEESEESVEGLGSD